jgi:hypothetical protein
VAESRPYGVTQNADAAAVTANALVGKQIASIGANAVVEGAAQATGWSTAPYKPRSNQRGAKGCYAKGGTCGAPALRGERLCFFHSQEAK